MNKNKKLFAVLAVISALIALAAATVVSVVMLVPNVTIRLRFFYLCLAAAALFTILVRVFVCKAMSSERAKKIIVRITMIFALVLYLVTFFGFLFLIKAYSNHDLFLFRYNKNWLRDALPGMIPFKQTAKMIYGVFKNPSSFSRTVLDLGGNMMAYVPLAFFLPAMFKNMRRFDSFLPVVFFVSVATEIFQGMFGLGTCQIDDFILGVGCACIVFYILRRPKIIKWFSEKYIYF